MRDYEEIQRQFDAALMQSEKLPPSQKKYNYEGVRDALGWVLEEYQDEPIEDVEP